MYKKCFLIFNEQKKKIRRGAQMPERKYILSNKKIKIKLDMYKYWKLKSLRRFLILKLLTMLHSLMNICS